MAGFNRSIPVNGGGPKPPCAPGCPNRSATCHTECAKYRDFAEKRHVFREERFKENEMKYTVGKRYTNAFFDRKAKLKRDGRKVDR